MIKNGIYVLREDTVVQGDLQFKKNQEIEVVSEVLYMGGYMLPPDYQQPIKTWMQNNLSKFKIDNRNF